MRPIYICIAPGEEEVGEKLAMPLRAAGYSVTHDGTITIGESRIDEATKLLDAGCPIILCATARAAGNTFTRKLIAAAHAIDDGRIRVFVVQMESDADVSHLSLRTKVARYFENPALAERELVGALSKHYPLPEEETEASASPALQVELAELHFLDQPTGATLDPASLARFRERLRAEVKERFPGTLSAPQFLDGAALRTHGYLTRAGALLFAADPTMVNPSAMVKCTQYYGRDRDASRDMLTVEGALADQIIAARDFIGDRVALGEAPTPDQAEARRTYRYPMIAVREVIANALVHRDYGVTDRCVHVRLFADRLEVSSPGVWSNQELTDGETYDFADLARNSVKMNYRLAHLLSWIKLVEGEGSGVPTAVGDCQVLHTPAPVVVQDGGFVTVTVRPSPSARRSGVNNIVTGAIGTVLQTGRVDRLFVDQRPVPRQLPQNVPVLVGRTDLVAALHEHLLSDTNTPGVVLEGMAGVGKTALAVRWAREVSDQFPDGQLYVDLRGFSPERPLDPAQVLRSFLLALDTPSGRMPSTVSDRAALYRTLTASRKMLIVLDNARDSEQVRSLLPGGSSCFVVVTGRSSLVTLIAQDGFQLLPVGLMGTEAARDLLATTIGPERLAREPAAVMALVDICAGLPLALRIIAARAKVNPHWPLSELVSELRDERYELDGLDLRVDPAVSVRSALLWSYKELADDAAHLFRTLSLHPGHDFGLDAAAALAGLERRTARNLLAALTRAHLLEEYGRDRFRFHDLLHVFAAELSEKDDPTDRQAATDRLLEHYSTRSARAADKLNRLDDMSPLDREPNALVEGMLWFQNEMPSLFATVMAGGQFTTDPQRLWTLADSCAVYLDRQGQWEDLITIQSSAVQAANLVKDSKAAARSRYSIARARVTLADGDRGLAELREVLTVHLDLTDASSEQAQVRILLARLLTDRALYEDALVEARAALELSQDGDDPCLQAEALSAIGVAQAAQRSFDEARASGKKAFDLSWGRTNDAAGLARVLDDLGTIQHLAGHQDEALDHLHEALDIWRSLEARYPIATTLKRLGDVQLAREDTSRARACWNEALEILTNLRHPGAQCLDTKLSRLRSGDA